jgi:DNA-binding PadR family transcriptional regulator
MVLSVSEEFRITTNVAQLLAVLLDDPRVERYGLELMRATGQPSGTLYPILARLQTAGWVRAGWENIDPSAEGRPQRRYYSLTRDGAAAARVELTALDARLRPRPAGDPRVTGSIALATQLGWWA